MITESNTVKHVLDAGAALGAFGAFMHWMPDVAGLLACIWYLIRFLDMYRNWKSKNNFNLPWRKK